MTRLDSADVQRRKHEQLVQRLSISFRAVDLKFATQIGFDIWNFRQRCAFGGGRRFDILVEIL